MQISYYKLLKEIKEIRKRKIYIVLYILYIVLYILSQDAKKNECAPEF